MSYDLKIETKAECKIVLDSNSQSKKTLLYYYTREV